MDGKKSYLYTGPLQALDPLATDGCCPFRNSKDGRRDRKEDAEYAKVTV